MYKCVFELILFVYCLWFSMQTQRPLLISEDETVIVFIHLSLHKILFIVSTLKEISRIVSHNRFKCIHIVCLCYMLTRPLLLQPTFRTYGHSVSLYSVHILGITYHIFVYRYTISLINDSYRQFAPPIKYSITMLHAHEVGRGTI